MCNEYESSENRNSQEKEQQNLQLMTQDLKGPSTVECP